MAGLPKKNFMTPQATLAYAYLTKPDTAFDSEGVYKTDFRLMPDAAKPLLDDMRAVAKEAFGAEASKIALPYKVDDETGELTFKVKSKYAPRIVDASGQAVDAGSMPMIYGGSEARIAGNIQAYDTKSNKGVTLQLAAVQVISLAERQGGANFGAVEGGFVASNDNADAGEASYNF
jgi:hypothetical protein